MKSGSSPDVSTKWAKVEELYNKKLWHQLTRLLQELVKEPSLQVQDIILTFCEYFVNDFF